MGRRIKTIQRLRKLAYEKRAVKFRGWGRPVPAVFVFNMTCPVVLNLIQAGLFEYRGAKK